MINISNYNSDTTMKKKVLQTVYEKRRVTRGELTKILGLSLTSVTKFVGMLISDGIIVECGLQESMIGRKTTLLGINPDYACNLGIDIGGFALKLAVVRMDGTIIEDWFIRIQNNFSPINDPDAQIINPQILSDYINEIFKKYDIDRFMSICIGISGMVDNSTGTVIFCPNLQGWDNVSLRDMLAETFELPIFVDTSARCMALAEQNFGAGIDVSNQLFISLGSYSIASALIFDSCLYRGSRGFSGEIGHVMSSDTGNRCSCGNYDCLELTATMLMFINEIHRRISKTNGLSPLKQLVPIDCKRDDLTPEIIQEAIKAGDKLCYETVMDAGVSTGIALSNLLNILDLELVILGGGVVEFFPEIIDTIQRTIRERTLVPIQQNLKTEKAELDWHGAVSGSTILALTEFFK